MITQVTITVKTFDGKELSTSLSAIAIEAYKGNLLDETYAYLCKRLMRETKEAK